MRIIQIGYHLLMRMVKDFNMKQAEFSHNSEIHFSAKVGHDHFLSVEYDIRGVWLDYFL